MRRQLEDFICLVASEELTELNFKAHKTVLSIGLVSHKLFGEGWR